MRLCQDISNMIYKKISLLLFLLTTFFANAYSQNIFSDLRRAEKKADYYYTRLSYSKAIQYYSQALKKEKNKKKYVLNIKVADLYKKMGQYEKAKNCFENVIATGHKLTQIDSINYFNVLKATDSQENDTILSKYFSSQITNDHFRDTSYYTIEELTFNSNNSEYCPVSYNKGLMYISDQGSFSIVKKYNAINGGGFTTLYYREKKDSIWSLAKTITIELENIIHIGPISFYNNQKEAILNVCIRDKKKPYRLLLYKVSYDSINKRWYNITPLPFNNETFSVGHPAISENGKTIFFISDRKGGIGGTDIYVSNYINGNWSSPINLGPKINSEGDEKYPYISKDNILFFSSNGRYGMGGLDVFYTDLDSKDTVLLNMGYPINSNLDDFSFHFNEKEKIGYFSSNRNGTQKQDDLYVVKENKILLNLFFKDDFNKNNINDVLIQIWDTDLKIQVKHFQKNVDSIYTWLKPNHNYKIIIEKTDYRNDTITISTISTTSFFLSKTIYLKKKYIYYGNLKLKNDNLHENSDTSIVIINNITSLITDTVISVKNILTLKLDAECEYIITSKIKDILNYIYVEKKIIKNLGINTYYNMYLSSVKPTLFRVIIKKCTEEPQDDTRLFIIKIVDWVNKNKFEIKPGPDGDFQFIITDPRLFDISISNNGLLYSKQEIKSKEFCMSIIH